LYGIWSLKLSFKNNPFWIFNLDIQFGYFLKSIMKKKIKHIIIFLFALTSYSQNNISILYKLKIFDEEGIFKNNQNLRDAFLNTINSVDKTEFKLIIAGNNAKFYKDKNASNTSEGFVNGFSGFTGNVYYKKDSIYSKIEILGNNIFLKTFKKENWNLEKESKMIDNFLCYKATNLNKVIGLKDKIWNHPVVAWYCPELPFAFGPNGYGNLPGLILELQVRNVSFTMSKIDFDSKDTFEIDILKRSKLLSESESNIIFKEKYEIEKSKFEKK
jgi:GLPGLI family protein